MSFKIPAMLGAALVALACATPQPAMAQYGYGFGGGNINAEQRQILNRINIGRQQGFLTRAEYNRLMARYNQLAALEAQYRMGGLSWQERRALSNRLDNLQFMLRRDWTDRQRDWRYSNRPRWWY